MSIIRAKTSRLGTGDPVWTFGNAGRFFVHQGFQFRNHGGFEDVFDPVGIAVHMGGGGAGYAESEQLYRDTRAMGLRRSNLRFALSARRDTHTLSDLIAFQLAGDPFNRNLFCASDAPYGLQACNFGAYREIFRAARSRSMTHTAYPDAIGIFGDEAEKNFLGRKFFRLAINSHERVVETLGINFSFNGASRVE